PRRRRTQRAQWRFGAFLCRVEFFPICHFAVVAFAIGAKLGLDAFAAGAIDQSVLESDSRGDPRSISSQSPRERSERPPASDSVRLAVSHTSAEPFAPS